ncbi:hypothetical protein FEE95_15405 [Maribacter algarum]|uniref:DUF4251 domain-containing protein n=1 Tax=Maribacter algarum (ex Zhang et al. 2020) TaxID=2578118 RepID=A0A5S3QFH7_9FLAO|nr:hypothetical protein [Maribacter algarum]TMM56027.1 hypothetical protein FEE95_15405 [Maribacter algarum]
MKRLSIFLISFLISGVALGQGKLSKKELREKRKAAKQAELHQKLVESVKDSSWGFFPYKITSTLKSGDDGGMFTFSDMRMTLFNVFIPNAKNVDKQNRIPSYDAQVSNYNYEIDDLENIQISLVFEYERDTYSFLLKKLKDEKWASLKLLANNKILGTYNGPLKQ